MVTAMRSPPSPVDDARILAMIEQLIESGERDDAGGGISAAGLAEALPAKRSALRKHLVDLADRGELVEIWGIGGPQGMPRSSYLPADHDDAQTDEVPEHGVTG